MPIKDNREYRNLGMFCRAEHAEAENDKLIVEGTASTFDEYFMYSDPRGYDCYERIDRHAFDDADLSDVVFLLDHAGRVYARTKNGSLEVSTDDEGLRARVDLSRTSSAREVYEDIQAGNYLQMSFCFTVAESHDERSEGKQLRVVDKIEKVYDVSAVAFPANPYTDIGVSARALFDGAIKEREAERLLAEHRELERKKLALKIKISKGI